MPGEVIRTRHRSDPRAGAGDQDAVPAVPAAPAEYVVPGGPPSSRRGFAHCETSVAEARRFACEVLSGWGIGERLDDMRLCLSEIATNALLHAVPAVSGFEVRLSLEVDAVVLEVHDDGGGRPARREPDGEDSNGRGLLLVEELADDWGVRDDAAGKTVWLVFAVRAADRS